MTICIWCASREIGNLIIDMAANNTSMAIVLRSMAMAIHTCVKLWWRLLMGSFQWLSH